MAIDNCPKSKNTEHILDFCGHRNPIQLVPSGTYVFYLWRVGAWDWVKMPLRWSVEAAINNCLPKHQIQTRAVLSIITFIISTISITRVTTVILILIILFLNLINIIISNNPVPPYWIIWSGVAGSLLLTLFYWQNPCKYLPISLLLGTISRVLENKGSSGEMEKKLRHFHWGGGISPAF